MAPPGTFGDPATRMEVDTKVKIVEKQPAAESLPTANEK
jgi:hypothetical protein